MNSFAMAGLKDCRPVGYGIYSWQMNWIFLSRELPQADGEGGHQTHDDPFLSIMSSTMFWDLL